MRTYCILGIVGLVSFVSRASAVPIQHSELPGQASPVAQAAVNQNPSSLHQVAFSVDTATVKKSNPFADFFRILFERLFSRLFQKKPTDTVTAPEPPNPTETDDAVLDSDPPTAPAGPTIAHNPEPSSIALMGIGFAGLVYLVRRQRRAC